MSAAKTAPETSPQPSAEPSTAVRIIAHRGDSESARENTLAAFAQAIAAGATDLELDVRTSADRVAVLVHDPTTLRLWGRPRPVSEQTAAELAELGTEGTRIPTLTEVVDLVTDSARAPRLLVDTKNACDARTAWTTLRTHAAVRQGRVQIEWCGAAEAVAAIRELDEDAVLHVDHQGGDLDVEAAERLDARVLQVEFPLLSPDLINQAHLHGLEVATWVLNDAEQMCWAIDAGVDAITTDRPRLLHQLATAGYSPLALAWADTEQLAARLGLGPDLARWIAVARQLAEWSIGFTATASLGTIVSKAHAADVVTEVDKAVERHVRAVINAEFPDHVIVGEEYGGEAVQGAPTWYLDPVDGTTNLANGMPWTAMSLALAVDGQPVVAAVAQPWTGEIYLAARGLGATLDGRPLHLSRTSTLAGGLVMTETAAHRFWEGQVEFMDRVGQQHCVTRLMGSGTLTLTRVASGDALAGIVHHFHPIDHLAGALIAHEAGARVVNSDGNDSLFPTGGGMMVAAPGAAEKLWPLWQPGG